MSKTPTSKPFANACTLVFCVLAIGTGARPESALAEEKQDDIPAARQPKQGTQAIELFVDLSLGVCNEQTAKERLKTLNAKDLMAAVKPEIEGIESDLVGVRQVTRE